ncbi:hypothetical protein AGLY_004591 [Aphis glycines]|uniref:Uncharacterized protein n=1 Tax=Aphis glycines TaxID=307491 RepID=A0A6G0TWM4_APHGL|nr:hypothetical protein AGLY_004591 [Aphis glycines]
MPKRNKQNRKIKRNESQNKNISHYSPVVRRGYLESRGLSADARYLTYVAHLSPVRGLVRRRTERTFHLLLALVDGHERVGANRERVVLVVGHLQLVDRVQVAGLQHFARLLRHVGARAQLQQPFGERRGRVQVADLVEHVDGRAEREDFVRHLQVAVRKVGDHLGHALLVFRRGLRVLLAGRLHHQPDQVLLAYVHQLHDLVHLLLGVHAQQRHGHQYRPELGHRFRELAGRRQLITRLQFAEQMFQFHVQHGLVVLAFAAAATVFPVAVRVHEQRRVRGQRRVRRARF